MPQIRGGRIVVRGGWVGGIFEGRVVRGNREGCEDVEGELNRREEGE